MRAATGMNTQFVRFLLLGGLAALVNMGSRWVFSLWLDYSLAIVLAYIMGMLTAFVTFRKYVFKNSVSGFTSREVVLFIFVNCFALLQTYAVSVCLAEYVFPLVGWNVYPRDFAHMTGVLVPVFVSFFCHKYFTFRKEPTCN